MIMKIIKTQNTKHDRVVEHPIKTFATEKEVTQATNKAMIKYADALKRLADR